MVHSKPAQQITYFATFLAERVTFCATFVYAFNKDHQRVALWQEIQDLSHLITVPWCVSGDFNCILALNEVKGGREHWTPGMQSFLDCTSDALLGQIKTVGSLFTWTNKRVSNNNSLVQKRLDRMLCNKEWFDVFSEGYIIVKNKGLMDHCPLLCLVPMHLERVRKSFQFF